MDKIQVYWRKKLFYSIDKLRNQSISRFIEELKEFETEVVAHHNVSLKLGRIINIANKNTAFYKEKKQVIFGSLPVVNKRFLVEHAAEFRNVAYSNKELISVQTSGSYGLPFTFMLTKEKKRRQKAEVLFYGEKAGYDVGVKHAYVRSNPPKSAFKFWVQNEVFYAAKTMDFHFLENARKSLLDDSIRIIIGFPTAIARIAQYCIDIGHQPSEFKIDGVICCSENLTTFQRKIINQAFNCKVHNRYSTEELGVLGYQSEYDSGFQVNTCNYVVEVLNIHNDQAAVIGDIGRIVVTDLHSDAFPLIRYETGDLGVAKKYIEGSDNWVAHLENLSGRTMQILQSTLGTPLYPLYLDTIMEDFPDYIQYQLIQKTAKHFIFNLIPIVKNNDTIQENAILIEKLKEWLGNDATIEIIFVADLKQLPSGKRPYIINELSQ